MGCNTAERRRTISSTEIRGSETTAAAAAGICTAYARNAAAGLSAGRTCISAVSAAEAAGIPAADAEAADAYSANANA
ncbi:MAG: hypothetical protein ACOYCB_11960 [Fastidiosipilaceae bacterium]